MGKTTMVSKNDFTQKNRGSTFPATKHTKNEFLGIEKMRKRHKNVREMHIKLHLREGDKNNLLEPPNRESLLHIHSAK